MDENHGLGVVQPAEDGRAQLCEVWLKLGGGPALDDAENGLKPSGADLKALKKKEEKQKSISVKIK